MDSIVLSASSLCNSCPQPGHCCHNLKLLDADTGLEPTFWKDEGVKNVEGEGGRAVVTCAFECPRITPEGRCSDYEGRPKCCWEMEPGVSPLCILTPHWVTR